MTDSSPPYVSVSLTPEGREALRRLAATLSGPAGHTLSLSEAVQLAEKHSDAIVNAITGEDEK